MTDPGWVWQWFTGGAWILFAVYGSFGILPFVIWGPIYWWKCERQGSFLRALGYGAGYAVYIYTFYITSWRARVPAGEAPERLGEDAAERRDPGRCHRTGPLGSPAC